MNKEEETKVLGKLAIISKMLYDAESHINNVRYKIDNTAGEEECSKEPSCINDYLNTIYKQATFISTKMRDINSCL